MSDEVLVRVEGVSKKFCRSLKKSLWYGVCDIASELNPFGRTAGFANLHKNLTTEDTESTEGGTGLRLSGQAGSAFSNLTTSRLAVDSQNTSLARAASNPCSSGEKALDSRPSPLDSTHGLRAGEFFAVKDVSFELRRGECLGLIGHNGAGKTTLLKMLNGLIKPDAGSITMRGRVGALIALGAGFNPILTGRENIYINGSVLGLTKKEIDAKIDEIIDFAEIREFIDMPVQSYSSGMSVRLGFAVATAMDPDVLILDEVLAVGDAAFRAKCYSRISKIQANAAIIFVSHAMDQVARLCPIALYLERGRSSGVSSVEAAADKYETQTPEGSENAEASFERLSPPIQSISYSIPETVQLGEDLEIQFTIDTTDPITDTFFRLVFFSPDGAHCAELNSEFANLKWSLKKGRNDCKLTCAQLSLRPGRYKLGLMYFRSESIEPVIWIYKRLKIEVHGPRLGLANYAIFKAQIQVDSK